MGVVADVRIEIAFPTDPLSLSPTAWWKADSLLPTLAHDDPVSTWPDSSGNGRDLTASGTVRPTFKKGTLSGRPSVHFDGVNDSLTNTSATLADVFGTDGVSTVVVVYRKDQTVVGNEYIFNDSSIQASLFLIDSTDVIRAGNVRSGGTDFVSKASTFGFWHLGMRGKDSTTLYVGEDDLSTASLVSTVSGAMTFMAGTLRVGSTSGSQFFTGDIVEIIVFSSFLSQADRLSLAAYFNAKYLQSFTASANSFQDVTEDVLAADGIRFRYGMPGNSQRDRVASTGVLSFALINSEANSAGLAGYYSPGHVNQRPGFDFGVEARVKITYGGTDYYKFRGVIDEIVPTPGKAGRVTRVTCVDWMDEAARAKLRGIAVQIDQRADQVFSTILAGVSKQPAATSIDTDSDVFPVALDNTRDESGTVLGEFQKLASSELGYIYVRGDTTQGGTLVFEGRSARGTDLVNDADFGDSTLWEMASGRRRSDIANLVKVVLRPRRIDTTAATVLASIISATNPLFLARNAVYPSFIIAYRDPEQLAIRAGGTEMASPVATTDYTFNSLADGTGTDLTAQLSVTATFGGNSVVVDALNNGPQDGWLTKLQVRGKGVYSYEPVTIIAEDEASQTRYGENTFAFEMPYQGNIAVGLEAAAYLLARGKDPLTQVDQMLFLANNSDALMTQALVREISDRIGLAETTTGIDNDDEPKGFFINAVEFDIREQMIRCAWILIPTDRESYWILESAGFSELDATTRPAFGIFT